jgi:hypothetical protein
MKPYTTFDRRGGPLLFDTDLRAVARADEKLRADPTAQLLAAAVDVILPDAELRRRVAAAWQQLYGTALLPGQRSP